MALILIATVVIGVVLIPWILGSIVWLDEHRH